MGIFDRFKKKSDKSNEVNSEEDKSYGWNAITSELERVYVGQTNPKHYGTLIKWSLGGKDPLDGISIYRYDRFGIEITRHGTKRNGSIQNNGK